MPKTPKTPSTKTKPSKSVTAVSSATTTPSATVVTSASMVKTSVTDTQSAKTPKSASDTGEGFKVPTPVEPYTPEPVPADRSFKALTPASGSVETRFKASPRIYKPRKLVEGEVVDPPIPSNTVSPGETADETQYEDAVDAEVLEVEVGDKPTTNDQELVEDEQASNASVDQMDDEQEKGKESSASKVEETRTRRPRAKRDVSSSSSSSSSSESSGNSTTEDDVPLVPSQSKAGAFSPEPLRRVPAAPPKRRKLE